MNFESFSSRIMDNREYSYAEKNPKTVIQKRFNIKKTKMQMVTITKKQFVCLNDKRFYFSDGITSLPYGHFLLAETRDKKKHYKHIHKVIMGIKDDLMRQEYRACTKCERIRTLRSILAQPPTYYKIDSAKRPSVKNIFQSTRDYILSGIWQ